MGCESLLPAEDVFVVPGCRSACLEAREDEIAMTVEVQDFPRACRFEGVSTDPVDDVAPAVHPSIGTVAGPALEISLRSQPQDRMASQRDAFDGKDGKQGIGDSKGLWKAIVELLDRSPYARPGVLGVIDGDIKVTTGAYQQREVAQSVPHGAGVMSDPPAIYDVELSELAKVGSIEHGSRFDGPRRGSSAVPSLEFLRAGGGLRVEVEGVDMGAQSMGGEREKTASASHIQES